MIYMQGGRSSRRSWGDASTLRIRRWQGAQRLIACLALATNTEQRETGNSHEAEGAGLRDN
jgi:hypothetical protein